MNAFISYATHPSEQYIVSLLAKKLADNQIGVMTNFVHSDRIDVQISSQIRNAALFIGLVTASSNNFRKNQVFAEYQFALQNQKPSILLVEQGTTLPFGVQQHQYIVFNRFNIEAAMEVANRHINLAKETQRGKENAAWLLGGVAVLALLAILANDKN